MKTIALTLLLACTCVFGQGLVRVPWTTNSDAAVVRSALGANDAANITAGQLSTNRYTVSWTNLANLANAPWINIESGTAHLLAVTNLLVGGTIVDALLSGPNSRVDIRNLRAFNESAQVMFIAGQGGIEPYSYRWDTTFNVFPENASEASSAINPTNGFVGRHLGLDLGLTNTDGLTIDERATNAAITIAADYQPLDADLTDLADGSLTGSKVGSGISAGNITSGTIDPARLGSGSGGSSKFLREDSTFQDIPAPGAGDALTSDPLSQFAATTSAELRGVLTDEDGTGVFLTANGSGATLTVDASGFNGNLATTDNTLQEVAQKVDDLVLGGSDADAIHDNVSGEIAAVADKATPVAADHLLIEDSAASNAKKDITVGSLESALEGVIDLQDLQGAVTDGQVPNSITVDLAATATILATARNIGNVSFDGSAAITPEQVAVVDGTDSTSFPLVVDSATGNLQPKTDAGLTYNASNGTLDSTALTVGGNRVARTGDTLTGDVTATIESDGSTATTIASSFATDAEVAAVISDTAFASSWNGVTTIAPTKNAVYDIIHVMDPDDDGKVSVLDVGAGIVKTDSGGVVSVVGSIDLGSSDASGTLAAARFPALTSDVTTSAGSLTATLANVPTTATFASSLTTVPNNTGGWTTYKVASSDATTTGQSLVDITGLVSGTLGNSTLYEIDVVLLVTTSTGTAGTQYGVNGGGTGSAATINCILTGTTTAAAATSETINAIDTASTARLTAASITGTILIKGFVTTRSTGTATIAIRHLKVTSGTSTVKIGSTFRIRKV